MGEPRKIPLDQADQATEATPISLLEPHDMAQIQRWPNVPLNGRQPQPRSLVNRNVYVGKHRTSVRLEPAMWQALAEICQREGKNKHELCTMISQRRTSLSLTSAIRVFIMSYFRAAATDEGHASAGHGTIL